MRLAAIASLVVASALFVAACGGGGSNGSKPAAGGALVNTSNTVGLGNIVVGPTGRTLYVFLKDTGPTSTCSGACAAQWPPLITTGKLTTSGGVSSTALKAVRRSDGKMQVTFNGHPLYYFAGDSAPGDAKGQGLNTFGARWYAVSPSGKQVTDNAGEPPSHY
jgi:predicted lipoprotein with Yx(FWY)xxD motif